MPNDGPNQVDEMLRAYADKRRAEAGAPFDLHPATRNLLQGEVARQQVSPQPASRSWVAGLALFWPRLAWAVALVVILGVAVQIWLRVEYPWTREMAQLSPTDLQAKKDEVKHRQDRAAAAAVVKYAAQEAQKDAALARRLATRDFSVPQDEFNQERKAVAVAESDKPKSSVSDPLAPANLLKNEVGTDALAYAQGQARPTMPSAPGMNVPASLLPPAGLAGREGFTLADADALLQAQNAAVQKESDSRLFAAAREAKQKTAEPALQKEAETRLMAQAELDSRRKLAEVAKREALKGQSAKLVQQSGAYAGMSSPAQTTPSTADEVRNRRAAEQVMAKALPPPAAPRPENALRFQERADTTSAGGLAAMRQRFARLEAGAKAAAGKDLEAATVLTQFQFEQAGDRILITDADGSLYEGHVVPRTGPGDAYAAAAGVVYQTNASLAKPVEENARALQKADAPVAPGGPGRSLFFRVSGTNRTLNQIVAFEGTLVTAVANGYEKTLKEEVPRPSAAPSVKSFAGGGGRGQPAARSARGADSPARISSDSVAASAAVPAPPAARIQGKLRIGPSPAAAERELRAIRVSQ